MRVELDYANERIRHLELILTEMQSRATKSAVRETPALGNVNSQTGYDDSDALQLEDVARLKHANQVRVEDVHS